METPSVYTKQGFGQEIAQGRNPALIVVDFVNGFLDPDIFGGGNCLDAAERTIAVLAAARQEGLPVIFTRIVYAEDGSDHGVWVEKVPRLADLTEDVPASQVTTMLQPRPDETVLRKTQASAFFGTGLAGLLAARGIDTVFIAGATTSGCVRATVVDAISHDFRPIVIRDCVGDRAEGPHLANLFDMEQKYAQVIGAEAAVRLMAGA